MTRIKSLSLILSTFIVCLTAYGAAKSVVDQRLMLLDEIYRLFDAPAGMDQLARNYYVANFDAGEFRQILDENGIKVYTLELNDPENEEEGAVVNIPPSKPSPMTKASLFKPEALRLDITPGIFKVEYVIPVTGSPDREIMRIRDVFKTAGCSYIDDPEADESESEPLIVVGSKIFRFSTGPGNKVIVSATTNLKNNRWYSIPAGYIPSVGFSTLPPTAPCNQGKEPFNTFIRKFNTSAKFRADRTDKVTVTNEESSRLKGSIGPEFECDFNRYVVNALGKCKLLPLKGQARYKMVDGEKDYDIVGQWFYPSANRVIYSGWNTRGLDEYESNSVILLFERVDGKWYCTDTYFFGTLMSDAVKVQFK